MTRSFYFAGTRDDSIRIVESILTSPTTRVVVDRWYRCPGAPLLRSLTEELRRDLPSHCSLFLWDERHSSRPISFRHNPGATPLGEYKIEEERGGPLLTLLLPPDYVDEHGVRWTALGWLSRQTDYWDDPDGSLGARAAADGFFDEVKKRISPCLKTLEVRGKKRRVGADCARALKEGTIRLRR